MSEPYRNDLCPDCEEPMDGDCACVLNEKILAFARSEHRWPTPPEIAEL